jgi:tRNA G18 (ribose-2'-O)-methylase SpoU
MRKLRNSELNRLSTAEFKRADKLPIIVALDDVRSMHNVGSVFRTSDAFKVERLILGGITPAPPLAEIEKTALGSTQSVDWVSEQDLKSALISLKKDGYTLVSFEQTSVSGPISNYVFNKSKVVLVFGNEVKGVSLDILKICDQVVEIPQFGTKHSLNISVSAGIGIWEFAKQFIK